MIGRTLAHYEITDQLGEGGMGEVYRARDTKLGREVAIKVLPPAFADDPERLARFRREAKVLASLNHPNVAGLFGFEKVDDTAFLVMEVAEGRSLAALMEGGALPLEDALRFAEGVASGLEEAHDKGIVHRDLKPANVVVGDGKIKILDFGLATAYAGDPAEGDDILNSPTVTQAFTQAGTILGTAAYMSPEQARGKKLDKRTDIWSFGVMLFEMLTGDRVFHGETVTDTLAGILHRTPDLEKLPPSTPPSVRRILARCLEKDPDRRLRDIGEARIALSSDAMVEPMATPTAPGLSPSGGGRPRLGWSLAVLATVTAGVLGWMAFQGRSHEPVREIRASISPPEDVTFEGIGAHAGSLTLSPDGRRITFSAGTGEGAPQLWVRSLDSDRAVPLPGTEGANFPFWSPDGQQLAFFAGGKLKKLTIGGGAPITVCDASDGRGGTWNEDDVILFAPATQVPIHRVSAGGGTPVAVTTIDPARDNETTHRFPWFLPDGRSYLFVRGSHSAAGEDPVNSLWVGRLDSDETQQLFQSRSNAAYARGHIFWVRDGFLMARPFDPVRLELKGDGFPVAEEVSLQPDYWRGAFAVSEQGLVVVQHGLAAQKVLAWFDREGNELDRIDRVERFDFIRVSPDGRRIAAQIEDESSGGGDIWLFDVDRKVGSRLTFSESNESTPVWSPDGQRIAFGSNRDGPGNVFARRSDGRGEAELLFASDMNAAPWHWSPDGRYLAINHSGRRSDILILDLESGEATEFIASEFDDGWGCFSPDGNWMAYLSNESGRYDLYLTRFPSGDGKWLLSTQGADWLLGWKETGDELYYLDLSGALTAVKVDLEGDVSVDIPQTLFSTRSGNTWANFSDGRRFVLGVPETANADYPITLIVDWQGRR